MFNFEPTWIVDDSEIDRYILRRQLKSCGIKDVVEFVDAAAVKQKLNALTQSEVDNAQYPQLLILDLNMPMENGLQLLEAIQPYFDNTALRDCRVFMYTGSDDPSDHAATEKYPMVAGFITKGATPEDIQHALSTLKSKGN